MIPREEHDSYTGIARNHEAAERAAQTAMMLTGCKPSNLTLFRFKEASSWLFFNQGVSGPEIAIKVEPDFDGSLLSKRITSVALMQQLREAGAPLERHHIKPRRIGDYVVTITDYLSGDYDESSTNMHSLGRAIAQLHAVPIAPFIDRLPAFDPLAVTKDTFARLVALQDAGRIPRRGKIAFDDTQIRQFETLLDHGETAAQELVRAAARKGYEPSLLHNDITPYNALTDTHGNVVLIDFDLYMTGPWAYDLARPLGQWWRFGRPRSMAASLLEGYTAEASWMVDPYLLELSVEVAKARYAATMMPRIVAAAERGAPQNEYMLSESIRRVSGERYWYSEEDHLRKSMARQAKSAAESTAEKK